nr:helicase-related protein [Thiolinea sp.]
SWKPGGWRRMLKPLRCWLTATPYRTDGLQALICRQLGDIIHVIRPETVEQVGGTVPARVQVLHVHGTVQADSWNELLDSLTGSPLRNQQLSDIARKAAQRYPTLILTDRVEHAAVLAGMSEGALLVHGQLPAAARREALQGIRDAALTIGTTGLLGEGLDVSGWQCVVLATPISSPAKLLQAIGRVLRPAPGKTFGVVIDCVDDHPMAGSSFQKRQRIYRKRGFQLGEYR